MKVLVAPDSFGGWLGAPAIARRIGSRLARAGLNPVLRPLGDGGEGTAEVLAEVAIGAVALPTTGPLGHARGALCPLLSGPRLFIESAHALGPPSDDTRARWGSAHSGGLGTLLRRASSAARDHRARVLVGLGGSASVDGGLGLAIALGLTAEDDRGTAVTRTGALGLSSVRRLVGPPPQLQLEVWSDVLAPLEQAARVYGPQKGVPMWAVSELGRDLSRFAETLEAWAGRSLDRNLPGGGAAGGVGFALHALTGCMPQPGAEAVGAAVGLHEALAGCDAVLTGEGHLDQTSLDGKVVGAVVQAARARRRPVVAVVGRTSLAATGPEAPDAIFPAGASTLPALDAAADAAAAALIRH